MVTLDKIVRMAKKLGVDLSGVSAKTLKRGVKVELEHGYTDRRTNVTNDDLELTMKIALAHLNEYPDYYDRLEKMEEKAKKYWRGKKKPKIFL